MQEKIYFHLLVLCGILSHGIIGTFANEESKELSDFHIRHKRVVSHVPGEDNLILISNARHVVIIKYNMRIHCTGNIISHFVVITAASCVIFNPSIYQIVYGTSTSNRGKVQDIIDIRKRFTIALLTTRYPFVYGAFSENIQLHVAPLLPGTVGQVNGWGFNFRGVDRGTQQRAHLRSIEVPIMAHRECVNRYRPLNMSISDREVCTYDPQRHCGHTDFGAGLVIDGYLAGVFLGSGIDQSKVDPHFPDIFAVLQHSDYSQWIRSNMQEIDERMFQLRVLTLNHDN